MGHWPQCQEPYGTMPYDLGLAKCFSELGIFPAHGENPDTGERRFHAFGPVRELRGDRDTWLVDYDALYRDWAKTDAAAGGLRMASATIALRNQLQCCATDTITFHYVEAEETKWLYKWWHESAARIEDVNRWPQTNGYGRRASTSDANIWSLLRKVGLPAD